MSDIAFFVLVLLAFPAGIVPLVLQRKSLRRNAAESTRVRLAAECFSGDRHVAVSPQQWRLPIADVRQLAAQRGYQEAPPPGSGAVAFNYAPDAVAQCADQGGSVVSAQQRSERDRVARELAEAGFSWARRSEIGGTEPDLGTFAGRHGARIMRAYGDQLDPMLLFGHARIGSVREIASHHAQQPRTSSRRNLVGSVITVSAVLVLLTLVGVFIAIPSSTVGWALLVAGPLLVGVAVAPFLIFTASGDTTERMSRLIREFDGRDRVHVVTRHFQLDRLTILDVATELGYAYSNHWNALRPTSRWYEGWTIFVPNNQPGDWR